MKFEIVHMEDSDGPEVLAIYEEGIGTGYSTFETSVPSWEEWKAAHLMECCFVAKAEGALLGWVSLSSTSSRKCYAGVAEVSLYVRESARRQGIGMALLEKIISESEARGFWTLQGATFPENKASLRLQARCGFRVIGYRERVAKRDGAWRNSILTERRSPKVNP